MEKHLSTKLRNQFEFIGVLKHITTHHFFDQKGSKLIIDKLRLWRKAIQKYWFLSLGPSLVFIFFSLILLWLQFLKKNQKTYYHLQSQFVFIVRTVTTIFIFLQPFYFCNFSKMRWTKLCITTQSLGFFVDRVLLKETSEKSKI